ncbi:flavin reductase family protein [Virgibacillus siamensis]|uniref:flavin reductase family protein n=1 Tax=Virgibacillus siamensis TaxID=480071 RepID=UPI000985F755|nr:flavin reductase family protein [Virgibacillus siamensis]
MDSREFRNAMGKFATGITIVTTEYDGNTLGMTVNAFMSVSLEPKLIAISIDEKASMYDKLQKTKKFGISILNEDQKDFSMVFARQKEKDQVIPIVKQDGIPVIDGAIATLSCHVKETATAGDHMIFIAEVTDLNMNQGEPIIFYSGKYRALD